jgi:hypothetical protein
MTLSLTGAAFSGCNVILSVSLLALAVGANGAIYSGEQSAMMGIFLKFSFSCHFHHQVTMYL